MRKFKAESLIINEHPSTSSSFLFNARDCYATQIANTDFSFYSQLRTTKPLARSIPFSKTYPFQCHWKLRLDELAKQRVWPRNLHMSSEISTFAYCLVDPRRSLYLPLSHVSMLKKMKV